MRAFFYSRQTENDQVDSERAILTCDTSFLADRMISSVAVTVVVAAVVVRSIQCHWEWSAAAA
jgi:hypothetical protein